MAMMGIAGPNIHTVQIYGGLTPVHHLKMRCAVCSSRDVAWLLPVDVADAVAYVAGGEIRAAYSGEFRERPSAG